MTSTTRRLPRLDQLDKADWEVFRGLLALIGLGSIVSLAAAIASAARGSVTFTSRHAGAGPAVDVDARAGAWAHYSDEVFWTMPDPSVWDRALVALPGVAAAALVLAAVWFLWRLVGQLQRGDDFGGRALAALRGLALVLTVGGLLWPFLRIACEFALNSRLHAAPGFLFSVDLTQFAPLVGGLLLLALLAAFRKGARLADDVDGLV